MEQLYKLVQWPESQFLMDHSRFSECIFCEDLEGHIEVGGSAYMVPVDLWNEIFGPQEENAVGSVLIKLREHLKKYGNLKVMSYDFEGNVKPINKICRAGEDIILEVTKEFEEFSLTIEDVIQELETFSGKNVLAPGKSDNYSGYYDFPLECFKIGSGFLLLEGIDL